MVISSGRADFVRLALRAFAIAIAIAAAIDPAISTVRRGRPIVSVRAMNPEVDSALARRVSQQLRHDARVIPARFGAADLAILVGDAIPADEDSVRTFIIRDDARPRVMIESVHAPSSASLNSNRRVDVAVRTVGARGRAIDVLLKAGDIVVDRVHVPVAGSDTVSHVQLSFVPTTLGTTRLRVEAVIVASSGASSGVSSGASSVASPSAPPNDVTSANGVHASADALVNVTDRAYAVLVYDPRPSWISTFVRRALERDPQFAVTSRVVTSRNISTSAGAAPERLTDLAAIARFDAIVVGAPEALTDRDVAGLEAFMRRRGGSVVLLLDQRASGAYDRLTDVREWRYQNDGVSVKVDMLASSNADMRSTELLWPSELPEGASVVAEMSVGALGAERNDAGGGRPIIWSKPTGAGRLIVSGALDAWRFRDSASSHFDRGWQVVVAEAASSAPSAITATLSSQLVAPGEATELSVLLRDAALTPVSSQPVRATVSAILEWGAGDSLQRTPIQLLPDGPVGSLRATFRAPYRVGNARIIVTADGQRAELPLVVDAVVRRADVSDPAFAQAFVASRGGKIILASQLSSLSAELAQSVQVAPRRERWHPMRAWWWLIAFAGALSAEWWMRRRGGRG